MYAYTLLFSIVTIIAVLIKSQPIRQRTIFEPGVFIIGLFSLCYLLPALAIVFGGDILPSVNMAIVNMAIVEMTSLYGFVAS